MAVTTIENKSAPRPNVNGWEIGFRVKGYGLTMIIPCDTRMYNLTVNSGSQLFLSSGWVELDGRWELIDKGTYYLARCIGQTVVTEDMVGDAYLLNITMTVSLK